jgi:hypothetical protein
VPGWGGCFACTHKHGERSLLSPCPMKEFSLFGPKDLNNVATRGKRSPRSFFLFLFLSLVIPPMLISVRISLCVGSVADGDGIDVPLGRVVVGSGIDTT